MKGIILANKNEHKLYPNTFGVPKHLLSIYDKPMIYYPISVLMLAGIQEILIISTPQELPDLQKLLEDGSQFGLKISYKESSNSDSLTQAFVLGEDFIDKDSVALILGNNIFYGPDFSTMLKDSVNAAEEKGEATIFEYVVQEPKSDYAVTDLYFYDNKVVEYAKNLQPSAPGKLEITDLNNIYLNQGKLNVKRLNRNYACLNIDSPKSLLQASQFVLSIEQNYRGKIACLEEIALRMGFISKEEVLKNIKSYKNNEYYSYVRTVIKELQ